MLTFVILASAELECYLWIRLSSILLSTEERVKIVLHWLPVHSRYPTKVHILFTVKKHDQLKNLFSVLRRNSKKLGRRRINARQHQGDQNRSVFSVILRKLKLWSQRMQGWVTTNVPNFLRLNPLLFLQLGGKCWIWSPTRDKKLKRSLIKMNLRGLRWQRPFKIG